MATIDQLAKAHRLHDQGKSYCQIAKACGFKYDTVRRWLDSEYRERQQESDRQRKAEYGGTCLNCGSPTSGSDGRANAPKHCRECAPEANRKWNRDLVVSAIRRFNERYGRPPCANDFSPANARRAGHPERAERFARDGDYPVVGTVMDLFGSWNEGISAAGFRPLKPGHYPRSDAGDRRRGAHLAEDHWTIENAA